MGQTWNFPMASTATLSDSRSYINDSCESLQSSFSGTSPPGTPVAGQTYFNTSTYDMSFYYGSDWKVIFNAEKTYGGLLPLTAGSGYPLSGDLYLGTKLIKNLGDPVDSTDAVTLNWLETLYLPLAGGKTITEDVTFATERYVLCPSDPTLDNHVARKAYVDIHVEKAGDTMTENLSFGTTKTCTNLVAPTDPGDAATKSYVDDEFDPSTGHEHDAADSKKIDFQNLLAGGVTEWGFVQTTPSGTVSYRKFDTESTEGATYVGIAAYQTLETVTLSIGADETRTVLMGFLAEDAGSFAWRLRRDANVIAQQTSPLTTVDTVVFGLSDSYAGGGSVTYTLEAQGSGSGFNARHAWICVI